MSRILLDPENPRLVVSRNPAQLTLLKTLYEDESLDELVPSLVEHGYFSEEPLVVVPGEPDELGPRWVVVEGNRRTATLKLLLDDELRRAVRVSGWPTLSEAQRARLEAVPCIIYDERDDVFPFLGFRHITGVKKWAPFQKARFVAHLLKRGRSLEEIQELIGDTTQAVKKLYQQHVVFQQIVDNTDIPERAIRDRFSLLEVALGQRPIKEYLGVPKRLPAQPVEELVPEDRLEELEEVATWVFGDGDRRAVISDSREIANRLAPVLSSEQSITHLKKTGDLEAAYEYSDGEVAYLARKIRLAEKSIGEVSALLAVYKTEPEIVQSIKRLVALTEALDRILGDS
ncbi:hypothetical protein LPW41_16210 [Microbacterium sp. JC 701]|uniref:hypothetical protein n=1 Tax=Microbacterium sp. JC 701 TaxID=2897389 RepID=UPI001E3FBBAD|nr:hypothetical protein [Microbacterium sp. JC 701]MCD2171238.1 hypothetical protein [Microbacterium sp. JC 701]